MDKLYRILVIRFDYLTAKCLFPIILNWTELNKATYELEIMNKIIGELNLIPGILKVRVVHNRVGTYADLNNEFNVIIGDINYNTPNSQIKTLSVDHKIFKQLSQEDIQQGFVERFALNRMYFPVRVQDPSTFTLSDLTELPMLVIEE